MKRKDVKLIIEEEKKLYVPANFCFNMLIHQKRYMIWQYLAAFRLAQYYKERINNGSFLSRILYRFYLRRKNILGEKTGVEIASHCKIGRCLDIWHGNVVISANLGDNCIIHGNNVLGNRGGDSVGIPILGNCVDVGAGAIIIGDIFIADNCIIGANAVVNKSVIKESSLVVGIPASIKER